MAFTGQFATTALADSVNPAGNRLVTMELTYPRCIHAEFMTHRAFSRNAASSRAIPIETMMQHVEEAPFVPLVWGANQSGMQAGAEVRQDAQAACVMEWLNGRNYALRTARSLNEMGLHKQIVNRVLEPWMWITVIATGNAPGWENFFKLRCNKDAEPHMQKIAYMARDLFDTSESNLLDWGECHLPLVGLPGDEVLEPKELKQVSTARCARVSYLTHAGERDVVADIALHHRLATGGHWSPFEHVATAMVGGSGGNLGNGWHQYRKDFETEFCARAGR